MQKYKDEFFAYSGWKEFLYISDNEIKGLLPLLPQEYKDEIKAKYKLDISLAFELLETDYLLRRPAAALFQRKKILQAFRSYSWRFMNVGSVEEPEEWIQDWKSIYAVEFEEHNDQLFYFGWDDETVFLLCGSTNQFVADVGLKKTTINTSLSPELSRAITYALMVQKEDVEGQEQASFEQSKAELIELIRPLRGRGKGFGTSVNFFARKLFHDPDQHVLLATPLYVVK